MTRNPFTPLLQLERDSLATCNFRGASRGEALEGPQGLPPGCPPGPGANPGRQEDAAPSDEGLAGPCFGRKRKKVACRATGNTKFKHRDCYQGEGSFSTTTPYWVDPDPCPALAQSHRSRMKRQREKTGEFAPPERKPKSKLQECANLKKNKGKVQKIVKLLRVDRALKADQPLPKKIPCGLLRQSVTAMYSFFDSLSLVDKLSIKTSAKAESQPCPYCESLLVGEKVDKWKEARLAEQQSSSEHLERFAKLLSANIEHGWNRRASEYPYCPNGAATETFSRAQGGNWNDEEFSEEFRVSAVFTGGKYRIVTMYSGYNVSVLTPLHNALYASIQKRGWLLVGSPTGEKLAHLEQACKGNKWHSFDYESATDNIKTAYVRRAVEVLIAQSEGLTEDEEKCLRVLSSMHLGGEAAFSGQPMGSPLSFPLLCLINKTVVDLALTDLMLRGEISFKEWTSHRCLINGDDLVTKSTSSGSIAEAIFANGKEVGLKSNWDKTLVDPEVGEINSTSFKNCVWQKKTNVSALWMSADVTDTLGYANESCVSDKGKLTVVLANLSRLARQKIKTVGSLKHSFKELLLSSKKIKRALCQSPICEVPEDTNLMPVVAMPDGYNLSREDEVAAINDRVKAIREGRLFRNCAAQKKKNKQRRKHMEVSECLKPARKGLYRLLKQNKPREEESVLSIFASKWEQKRKEELTLADRDVFRFDFTKHCRSNPFTVDLRSLQGVSGIVGLQQMIKQFQDKRKVEIGPSSSRKRCSDPWTEYVSLSHG